MPESRGTLLSAAGGSLVVSVVTPAGVYLSADSRYAGVSRSLRDSARKLLACGPTAICGLSGLVRFTRTEYDRHGDDITSAKTFELSEIVDGLGFDEVGEEPDLSLTFARRLQQALLPVWERFANQLDEPFGTPRAEWIDGARLHLAQLFYVNRSRSGRAFLSTIDLEHTVHRSKSGQYDSILQAPVIHPTLHELVSQPRIFVRGKRSCVHPQPLSGPVEGDIAALRIIERIFADARHGARCAAAVGGPVDVAVVDESGRRWLKRKEQTRDRQEPNPR